MGEYTCVSIPLTSLMLFPCISSKEDAEGQIAFGDEFHPNYLVSTTWHKAGTPTVGFLLPNFFIIYFGQSTPTGTITSDDVKMDLTKLGIG